MVSKCIGKPQSTYNPGFQGSPGDFPSTADRDTPLPSPTAPAARPTLSPGRTISTLDPTIQHGPGRHLIVPQVNVRRFAGERARAPQILHKKPSREGLVG